MRTKNPLELLKATIGVGSGVLLGGCLSVICLSLVWFNRNPTPSSGVPNVSGKPLLVQAIKIMLCLVDRLGKMLRECLRRLGCCRASQKVNELEFKLFVYVKYNLLWSVSLAKWGSLFSVHNVCDVNPPNEKS
jgi:hypothetical protein